MGIKPISPKSWEVLLNRQWIQREDELQRKPRLSLIGIGYELGGDDCVGVTVIRRLEKAMLPGNSALDPQQDRLQNRLQNRLQLINAGTAPENITGAVRRFRPDWILLIDAVDAGLPPGSITWLDPQATEGFSASTHTLPLQVVAQYLGEELLCPVDLIGIQHQSLEFAASLTPPVENAAIQVAAGLLRILRDEV